MALAQDAAAVSGELSGASGADSEKTDRETCPENRGIQEEVRETPIGDRASTKNESPRKSGASALSPLLSTHLESTSADSSPSDRKVNSTSPPQCPGVEEEAKSTEPTKDDLGQPSSDTVKTSSGSAAADATKTSKGNNAIDAIKTTASTDAIKTTASTDADATKTTASNDAIKTTASTDADATKTTASNDAIKTTASTDADATKTTASNDAIKTTASNDATKTNEGNAAINATKTTASNDATKTNAGKKTTKQLVNTTKTTVSKPPAEPTKTALDKELEALLSLELADPLPHDVLMIQSEHNGTLDIVKADSSLEDPSVTEGKGPPPPLRPATTWTSANLREFKHRMSNEKHGLLTIRRGEVVTVRVPTHPDGKRLCWEFATDDYDIGFGIYFDWTTVTSTAVTLQVSESSDEEEEEDTESPWHSREGDVERGSIYRLRSRYGEIMQVYRRDSHREVQAGSHEYPGEGVYLLKLDNSYSLLRNKTLYFHVYYSS